MHDKYDDRYGTNVGEVGWADNADSTFKLTNGR